MGLSGILAGEAFVRIGTDISALEKGLNTAKSKMDAFGKAIGALAGIAAVGFVGNKFISWVESFAEGGRELYLTSRQMQMSVADLQEMKGAAALLGLEMDSMTMAVNKVRNYVAELATSGQQTNDTMRELGLTLSDVANLSDLDRIQLFGERIRALGNKEMTARIGRQIFGRGGIGIAASAADLGGARAQARGGVMLTQEQVKQAFDLSQAMKLFDKSVTNVGKAIGAAIAPGFTTVYNAIIPIVKAIRTWVNLNQPLVQKLVLIGSLAIGFLTVLVSIPVFITLANAAWGGMLGVLIGIKAVILGIWGVLVFAFSPLTLALAALAGMGFVILKATGAFDAMGRAVGRIGDVFGEAFGGIKDAIMGGDLTLAWEIAMAAIRVLWIDFQIWFKNSFGVSVKSILDGFEIGWIETMAFIKTGISEAKGLFDGIWDASENAATDSAIADLRAQMAAGTIDRDVAETTIEQLEQEQRARNNAAFQASEDRRKGLIQTEMDRRAGRAGIANAGPGSLSGDMASAADELENLTNMAWNIAEAEKAMREEDARGLAGPQRGLEEFADRKAGAVGSFSSQALAGIGSRSPFARMEEQNQEQITLIKETNELLQGFTTLAVG